MNARTDELMLSPSSIKVIGLDMVEEKNGRKVVQAQCNGKMMRVLFPDYRKEGENLPVIDEYGVAISKLPQNSPVVQAILAVQKIVYLQTAMGSNTGR